MDVSRRNLMQAGLPLALTTTVGGPQDPSIRLFQLAAGAGAVRRFEDFGAKGDYDIETGQGTDDTASIQAAIDWAYGEGKSPARAILVEAKNYLCGPVTTHPYTTLIGSGRQTSNFICRPGTRGIWWGDRGNGAQKLMLSGLAWYGNGEKGLSAICRFGQDGIQFGSEGILQGLWMRDAPNAIGLDLSGNVGIVRDVTVQSLDTGIVIYGNGNQVETIITMQTRVGARFYGSFVRGLHVEAVDSGGLPLFLNGDSRVSDAMFSLAAGTRFDHLVEVDDSEYAQWSLRDIQVFARTATLDDALLKVGERRLGGKSLDHPFGLDFVPTMAVHGNVLSLAGHRWRSFAVTLSRRGGKVVPEIGPLAGTADEGGLRPDTGGYPGAASMPQGMAYPHRARWVAEDGTLALETPPVAVDDFAMTAAVMRNTTGRPVTVEPAIDPGKGFLQLRLWDAATGEPWRFPAGTADSFIRIAVSGFGGA